MWEIKITFKMKDSLNWLCYKLVIWELKLLQLKVDFRVLSFNQFFFLRLVKLRHLHRDLRISISSELCHFSKVSVCVWVILLHILQLFVIWLFNFFLFLSWTLKFQQVQVSPQVYNFFIFLLVTEHPFRLIWVSILTLTNLVKTSFSKFGVH